MTPSELRRRLLDLGVTPELSRDGRALWLDGLADEIADELVDEIVPSNVPWQPRAVSNQSGSGANPDLLVGDLVDVCRDEAATTDVEYRQGIPNHVHIEAATRLGLLWQRQGYSSRTLFRLVNGVVHSDFGSNPTEDSAGPLFIYERQGHYRPVRANGTPVAWSVLDAAASLAASPTTTSRPQLTGFRADLWRRICMWHLGREWPDRMFREISVLTDEMVSFVQPGVGGPGWYWSRRRPEATEEAKRDIIARWQVYQALMPLYDIVDGTAGEVPMPLDVVAEWYRQARTEYQSGPYVLRRTVGIIVAYAPPTAQYHGHVFAATGSGNLSRALANFSTVLDAVAELRLARGSHVSPTNPHVRIVVESNRTAANVVAQINRSVGTQVAHLPSAPGVTMSSAEARRIQEEVDRRLVTTLQSIEPGAIVTWDSGVTITHESSKLPAPASPILPTPPTPPTRFSLLELDDDIVTAKPTLLHTDGKAPTAVQVRRYRDAMESRIGVDLTKAAKDAQLDEVAVYILHRWLRGLDDVTVVDCIRFVHLSLDLSLGPKQVSQALLDERCEAWLQRYLKPTLDTREPVDTATQRRRQDVEEQRRRLADLAAKLAQERAADTTAPTEVTRWSLLELDGAAPVIEPTPMPAPQPAPDPLTVWWSRRAAQLAKRPAPSRFRIYLPPVPKRIDDWTTLPTELRDAALSYYVVVKGLEGLLN